MAVRTYVTGQPWATSDPPDGTLPLVLIRTKIFEARRMVRVPKTGRVVPQCLWSVEEEKFLSVDEAYEFAMTVLWKKLVTYS